MNQTNQLTLRGIYWNSLGELLSRIIQFIVIAIVAKFLNPEELGLFGIAMIFINIAVEIQDMGLGEALIQTKEDINRVSSIIFYNTLCLGVIWFFILFSIAPFIANYFNKGESEIILKVSGLYFLISPFSSIQRSLLRKELNFKKIFFLISLSSIISGIVGIYLAYIKTGIWSLVLMFLTGPLVMLILVWRIVSWRPIFTYNVILAKVTLGFGSLVSLSLLLRMIMSNIDIFLIGKVLGLHMSGIYVLGYKIAAFPYFLAVAPTVIVLYSLFCKEQNDKEHLKEYYLSYLYWVSFISFGLGIIVIATSYSFVNSFLGEKWSEVNIVIQLLSIVSIFVSLIGVNSEIYKSLGRPDIDAKFLFTKMLFSIPAYYIGVHYGLKIFCLIYTLVGCIFIGVNTIICLRILKLQFRSFVNKLLPSINTMIITIALLFAIQLILPNFLFSNSKISLIRIPLIVLTSYLTVAWFIDRDRFQKGKLLLDKLLYKSV